MYKVRFHLGRGEHFMHWQIKSKLNTGDGTGAKEIVDYIHPQDNQLALLGCKLSVQPTAAQKIHDGANKTVCAWIECETIQVLAVNRIKPNINDYRVNFNPHKSPDWTEGNWGNVVSGNEYELLFTEDRTLWVVGDAYECDLN